MWCERGERLRDYKDLTVPHQVTFSFIEICFIFLVVQMTRLSHSMLCSILYPLPPNSSQLQETVLFGLLPSHSFPKSLFASSPTANADSYALKVRCKFHLIFFLPSFGVELLRTFLSCLLLSRISLQSHAPFSSPVSFQTLTTNGLLYYLISP